VRGLEESRLGDLNCEFLIAGYLIHLHQIIAIFSVIVNGFKTKGSEVSIVHDGEEFSTQFLKVQAIKTTIQHVKTSPQAYDPLSCIILSLLPQIRENLPE
jgi:hypothetical protein